ncbi:MAG: ABC transporter permease [Nanobdellota archaeon]
MIRDYINIAWQSLKRRRLRSWLTLIGIIIGIAAVVSLISLGQGVEEAIYEEFESIGSDKLFIEPDSLFSSQGEGAGSNKLTVDDREFVSRLNGIRAVSSYTMTSAKIKYHDSTRYYSIVGVPTTRESLSIYKESFTAELEAGRDIEQGSGSVVVAGIHHAQKGLYDGENLDINSKIEINNNNFRVIGFYGPLGNSVDDKMLVMSENTFQEVSGINDRVDTIIVQIQDDKKPTEVAQTITRELAWHRDERVEDKTFTVKTPEDLLESVQNILDVVSAVLIGIAAISLFIGGVGIMNTMYTSVLERNKDIGIMKAIGARNKDIFILFAIESGLLGLVGGFIGIILGTGLAKAVEEISRLALGKTYLIAHVSIELFLGTILFSFIVGIIAGSLPALQAAKLQPADTLREE